MSTQDALSRATHALREHANTPGAADVDLAARTRRRVLLAAGATTRRRLRTTTLLVPIAAVLALSTAWAANRIDAPRVWRSLRTMIGGDDTRTAQARAPSRAAKAAGAAPPSFAPSERRVGDLPAQPDDAVAVEAHAPEVPTVDVSDLPIAARPAPHRDPDPPRAADPSLAHTADTPAPAPVDDEDALYARAHAAHFVDRDPEAALRAWDAYLSAYPSGRLAIEARYDRALTLVRLHRDDEARDALAPFAGGSFGAYRRDEARRLLEALAHPRAR